MFSSNITVLSQLYSILLNSPYSHSCFLSRTPQHKKPRPPPSCGSTPSKKQPPTCSYDEQLRIAMEISVREQEEADRRRRQEEEELQRIIQLSLMEKWDSVWGVTGGLTQRYVGEKSRTGFSATLKLKAHSAFLWVWTIKLPSSLFSHHLGQDLSYEATLRCSIRAGGVPHGTLLSSASLQQTTTHPVQI